MGTSVTPLPVGFQLDQYRILSIIDSDEWSILYQAEAADGHHVKIREFCPQVYSVRVEETGEIKFMAESPDALHQAKGSYDHIHSGTASSIFASLGTEYHVTDDKQVKGIAIATRKNPQLATAPRRPAAIGAKPLRGFHQPIVIRKKNSSGAKIIPFIILGFLAVMGFLVYQVLKTPPPVPEVVQVVAPKAKPKPKPKPIIVVAPPAPVVVVADPEPEPEPEPELEPEVVVPTYDPTQNLIKLKRAICSDFNKNSGTISDAIIAKYQNYAEAAIREYVTLRKGKFSPAFEDWLKKTKLNEDVFATFYPPDPNVATNVDVLVNALGERAYTYPQLVLAFAIGRREFGLGSFDLGHQGRYMDVKGAIQSMKNDGIWQIPADLFIKNIPPLNHYGTAPGTVLDSQYQIVHNYLSKNKLTPKQAWVNQERTLDALKSEGITKDNLAGLLHEELFRTNQLKRKRDPFPTCIEFFTFLVNKYEEIGSMKDDTGRKVGWDGVPLDCTPWQLMLPLSETRPLREAQGVWDRYLGKKKGPKVWRYGPYRMDDSSEAPIIFSMDPDPEWSPTSYERHLHVGGVCGTMSLIARTSQISMGNPGGPAGQPGHGNLVSYWYRGGIAGMTVDQSVDTMKNTSSCWYLEDAKTKRCGMGEYVLGLACSVNLSDKEQKNSRIAMNILKMVDEESSISEKTKEKALSYIVNNNPFYTEAWYMLFESKGETIDASIEIIDHLRKNTDITSKLHSRKPFHKNLGRQSKNDKDAIENNTKDYTSSLAAGIVEIALKKDLPPYKKSEWEKVMLWAQKEAKKNPYSDITELSQMAMAMSRGSDALVKTITADFQKLASAYKHRDTSRREAVKVSPETLVIQINAAFMVIKEKDKLPFLAPMVEKIPDALKFRSKDNNVFLTDLYKCITEKYISSSEKAGKGDDASTLKKDIAKSLKEYEEARLAK